MFTECNLFFECLRGKWMIISIFISTDDDWLDERAQLHRWLWSLMSQCPAQLHRPLDKWDSEKRTWFEYAIGELWLRCKCRFYWHVATFVSIALSLSLSLSVVPLITRRTYAARMPCNGNHRTSPIYNYMYVNSMSAHAEENKTTPLPNHQTSPPAPHSAQHIRFPSAVISIVHALCVLCLCSSSFRSRLVCQTCLYICLHAAWRAAGLTGVHFLSSHHATFSHTHFDY